MDEEELAELARAPIPERRPRDPDAGAAGPRPDPATQRALDTATADLVGPAAAPRQINGRLTDQQLARAAVLEQMAHGASYNGERAGDVVSNREGESDSDRRAMLAQHGYDPEPELITGAHGMQMVVFRPTRDGVAPVVSFRGSSELADLHDDLAADQVGDVQYESNEALIDETMRRVSEQYGQVELTGHSLGGALAQRTAAHHPDATGHITTFQAPGIDADEIALIDQHNERRIAAGLPPLTADHFRVDGDIVPLAGEAHAPGNLHQMTIDYESPWWAGHAGRLDEAQHAHRSFAVTAAALETEAGRAALPGIQTPDDRVVGLRSHDVREHDREHQLERTVVETVRSGVGRQLDAAQALGDAGLENASRVLNAGHGQVDRTQNLVGEQAERGHAVVDSVQRGAGSLARRGNAAVDHGQAVIADTLARGQTAIDQHRPTSPVFAPANLVVDAGQAVVGESARVAGAAVDTGQAAVGRAGEAISETVDAGQRHARTAVATGQGVVDRAQRTARSGERAVHEAWEWLTD
jgi:pimeloyl-ACP methyl ester carboxylesterase